MLWYILGAILGIALYKKRYNLSFWKAVGYGICLSLAIYFSISTVASFIDIIAGDHDAWLGLFINLFLSGLSIWRLTKVSNISGSFLADHKPQKEINEINQKYQPGEVVSTYIAGVTFENRQSIIRQLNIGDPLYLFPEFNNPYDENAIVVKTKDGNSVGYLKRELSKEIVGYIVENAGPPVNCVQAKIIKFTGNSTEHQGIEINFRIPTQEDYRLAVEIFFHDQYPTPGGYGSFSGDIETITIPPESTSADNQKTAPLTTDKLPQTPPQFSKASNLNDISKDKPSIIILLAILIILIIVAITASKEDIKTGQPISTLPYIVQKTQIIPKTLTQTQLIITTTPVINMVCITATVLNVRQLPTTNSNIVSGIAKGKCVEVFETSHDGQWLKVSNGWISKEFTVQATPQN